MKWARIQFQLSISGHPEWLIDSKCHEVKGTEPRGSQIEVAKQPGPVFRIQLKPWWGPEITFDNVTHPDLTNTYREVTDLNIVWESPNYSVYIDQQLVASKPDGRLAAAADLALPFEIYEEIEGTRHEYLLKRPPEQCEAWQLSEIPRYISTRFGIKEGVSEIAFLHNASNATQKARELVQAWAYGQCIDKIYKQMPQDETCNVAVLVPKDDRGVDCYLRLLRTGLSPHLTAIPLQICEVTFAPGETMDERFQRAAPKRKVKIQLPTQTPEEVIVSTIKEAKSKRTQADNQTLVCAIAATAPARADIMKLRDAFESEGKWPFDKVVCLYMSQAQTIAFTTYCAPPSSHFIIRDNGGDIVWAVGRTESEIKDNVGKQSTIRF